MKLTDSKWRTLQALKRIGSGTEKQIGATYGALYPLCEMGFVIRDRPRWPIKRGKGNPVIYTITQAGIDYE